MTSTSQIECSSDLNSRSRKKIWALIRDQKVSKRRIEQILGSLNLAHTSKNWDDLYEKRIAPIEGQALHLILREAEESGRQHSFLYMVPEAETEALFEEDMLLQSLAEARLKTHFVSPVVVTDVEHIEDGAVVPNEIRYDELDDAAVLVIKFTGRHNFLEKVAETPTGAGLTVRYREEVRRVVHLARVHRDGLIEVRIATRAQKHGKYVEDLKSVWKILSKLVPEEVVEPVSLGRAKQDLWERRHELTDEIRYVTSTGQNNRGFRMKAAAPSLDDSIPDEESADEGFERFVGQDGRHCTEHNLYWLEGQAGAVPSESVHVVLAGLDNEFRILKRQAREDCDFVLARIRSHNAVSNE